MAFRFQKRIKIAPGVRLNVSKSGVSTSLGGRGGTVNLSSKGVRTTVGIPGTGLSWSKQSGWSDAKTMKPEDELLQLGKLLDRQAKAFNTLSPKTNKVSEGWNKAVASFEGGRGPSTAKFQTLTKRFDTAMAGYQKIEDTVDDQRAELRAITDRLRGMRFGIFSGKLKAAQKDLLLLADEHHQGARKLLEALGRLRREVGNELSDAESKI
ncbi:DUF4236 domain-containing protein [Celeribacter sp.]|uniref:DUF4236 domain-containing protein n=1 Tax=Celeribacter sp. TaxID=1890673 RepID=UPI003A94B5F8